MHTFDKYHSPEVGSVVIHLVLMLKSLSWRFHELSSDPQNCLLIKYPPTVW